MRRFLVLTDESARHPFLAGLPPHVRHGSREEAVVDARMLRFTPPVSGEDVRQFLMAYCAFLLAAGTFIA